METLILKDKAYEQLGIRFYLKFIKTKVFK